MSELEARMSDARITPEMIEDMRARAGTTLRIEHSVNNEEATRLAILKFADAIGDLNPLWRDPAYAANGPFGRIAAPPSWVICCFAGLQFGWPGLGSFHTGSTLEFFEPVLQGDRITAECTYDGFEGPRSSAFADRVVIDHFTNTYRNDRGVVVARIGWSVLNFERAAARAKRKEAERALPHPWSEGDVRALEAGVRSERARGADPRWWEDTNEGDPLGEIVKGPLGLTDAIAYVAAGGAPIPRLAAHAAALALYERHPAWAFRDPGTSALEPIYAVHYNAAAARAMGVPMPYDVGFQRQCWQVHLLTHWAGDRAWVKHAAARYRAFVYLSDVLRLGGRVVRKYVDPEGEPCVDLETYALSQRDADVMPGTATVALPTRDGREPATLRAKRR